jgi:hypothetical protein
MKPSRVHYFFAEEGPATLWLRAGPVLGALLALHECHPTLALLTDRFTLPLSGFCQLRLGEWTQSPFYPAPVSERSQLVRCIRTRRGTGLRRRMRNRLEDRHGEVSVHLPRIHGEPPQAVS